MAKEAWTAAMCDFARLVGSIRPAKEAQEKTIDFYLKLSRVAVSAHDIDYPLIEACLDAYTGAGGVSFHLVHAARKTRDDIIARTMTERLGPYVFPGRKRQEEADEVKAARQAELEAALAKVARP